MSNTNTATKSDDRKIVHLRCKNSGCPSMTAYIVREVKGYRAYACTKCNFLMEVNTGGHVNL